MNPIADIVKGKKTYLFSLATLALTAYLTSQGIIPASIGGLIVLNGLKDLSQRAATQKAEDAANGRK